MAELDDLTRELRKREDPLRRKESPAAGGNVTTIEKDPGAFRERFGAEPISEPTPEQKRMSLGGPSDIEKKMSGLVGQEISDYSSMEKRREAAQAEDYARMKKAYAAEGIGIDAALKPWNAEQQTAEHSTDLVHTFGNWGTVFAVLASAFTRTPAINAMNGMASAINAVRSGDQQGYERAYQAWKDNTQLALKRFDLQHREFEDAVELASRDPRAGEGAIRAMLARYGMEQDRALIESGNYPAFLDAQVKRAQAAEHMAKTQEQTLAILERAKRAPQGTPEWFEWYQSLSPDQQAQVDNVMRVLHPGNPLSQLLSGASQPGISQPTHTLKSGDEVNPDQ